MGELQDCVTTLLRQPAAGGAVGPTGHTLKELQELGSEGLRSELERRGLATDGTALEHARRLMNVELKERQARCREAASRPETAAL